MILGALFAISLLIEAFLFLGKDYVLNTRRLAALEASLRQTYTDLQESQKRLDRRRADLIAALDNAEQQLCNARDAIRVAEKAGEVRPSLIHTVGQIDRGTRFRASVSKQLPAKPDAAQALVWTCPNFIDVWAKDSVQARLLADRQFEFKQGYDVGELVAVDAETPHAVQDVAA